MTRPVRFDAVHAAPAFRALPSQTKRAVRAALRALAEDPTGTTNGLDVKRLDSDAGGPAVHRLRVGDWRLAFVLQDKAILVVHVFHRRDGYGWMERRG